MNVYQVQVLSNKINEEATEENTTFLRILGAIAAFMICLFVLWVIEAFFRAGAGESSVLAAISNAFEQDSIISAICRDNPLRDVITAFMYQG